MKGEDTGYRLLGLLRYWNIIEYYYPYKDIINEDWDSVLFDFIPKFIEGNDYESYVMAIGELTTKIHDTHANVIDKEGKNISKYFGNYRVPASFIQIDKNIILSKPIYADELKEGDMLLSIDGNDIDDLLEERRKYISQSKEDISCASFIDPFTTTKSDVNVTLIRDEKELTLNVKISLQNNYADIETKSQEMEDGKIYYINAGQLKEKEIGKIMKKYKDVDGLILDLRNYPSVFITYELAKYLIKPETEFVKMSIPNRARPGEFFYLDPFKSGRKENNEDSEKTSLEDIYKGKLVILINEHTVSQGEFTAMSLRNTKGSVMLGRDTAGADGDVRTIKLPGNITTTISGLGVYHLDKTQTQRIGIKPDIYLDPTIQGIKKGIDEYIEKSIEIIKEVS